MKIRSELVYRISYLDRSVQDKLSVPVGKVELHAALNNRKLGFDVATDFLDKSAYMFRVGPRLSF